MKSTSTVGLTGGIATGKSTVAKMFAELGIPVIDADQLAREVVSPGSPGLEEIAREFGADVLTADGALDRKAMGAIVFGDPAKRKILESITHPRIARLTAERIMALAKHPAPFALYEAALIVENGAYRNFAGLIVVTTSPAVQLERVMARDDLSEADAQARIDAQMPMDEKASHADWVIHNDAGLAELDARVREVHELLSERFG